MPGSCQERHPGAPVPSGPAREAPSELPTVSELPAPTKPEHLTPGGLQLDEPPAARPADDPEVR